MANLLIKITDLKGIKSLDFKVPGKGTYVLTGENGIGKSTLFVCLEGIVRNDAFSRNFTGSTLPPSTLEIYKRARITYEHGDENMTIRFGSSRWRPSGNPNYFRSENIFSGCHTINATERRLYRQTLPPNMENWEEASDDLKNAMVELTGNRKFNFLRCHRAGDQRGTQWYLQREKVAFALHLENEESTDVFTDTQFSLGETMLLNLLYYFFGIVNKSLVLVDEIELALHPKVQQRLLAFFERHAQSKELTIIISTHSASLIKSAKNLLFLYSPNRDGNVEVIYNCYPSKALDEIAVNEDYLPDFIFFVEDKNAHVLLECMIEEYFRIKETPPHERPQFRILPVGGWAQVLLLLDAVNEYIFPPNVIRAAFLDADVEQAISAKRDENPQSDLTRILISIIDNRDRFTSYLPITPELGIYKIIQDNPVQMKNILVREIPGFRIDLQTLNSEFRIQYPQVSPNDRRAGKQFMEFLTGKIRNSCNINDAIILQKVMMAWVKWYTSNSENLRLMNSGFAQIFNTPRNRRRN